MICWRNTLKQQLCTTKTFVRITGRKISDQSARLFPPEKIKPHGYWSNISNSRKFLIKLARKLNFNQWEDWYRVSQRDLIRHGGAGLLLYGNIFQILRTSFPEYNWIQKKEGWVYYNHSSKAQQRLHECVLELFPNYNIHADYEINLLFPDTVKTEKTRLQLDVFIPELSLAFEYQGEQHYRNHKLFGDLEGLSSRDERKKVLCTEAGITLIEVPFWWKGDRESLLSSTLEKKPELKEIATIKIDNVTPIPEFHNSGKGQKQ